MKKKYQISVIITTHNRSKLLLNCVKSLAKQSIKHSSYELVVVDNYSNDLGVGTKNVCKKIAKKYPSLNIKTIFEKTVGGMALAKHRAIKESAGEIIVCADDDYIAERNLLKSAVKCFSDESIAAICGKLYPIYESSPPNWVKNITTSLPGDGYYIQDFTVIDLGRKCIDVDWKYMFWSNWAIRRKIFDELNGFGPDGFAGDFIFYNGNGEHFLNKEIARRGYRMVYCSDMSAGHYISNYRFTKKYFKSRYFHYGISSSFEKANSNKRVDSLLEIFFYILVISRQIIKDLISMPSFLKFRMIWVALGYWKHQKELRRNKFLLNYCKLKNYKNYKFSNLIPIQNKESSLW
jgi:GT2 family glycosyltransferase